MKCGVERRGRKWGLSEVRVERRESREKRQGSLRQATSSASSLDAAVAVRVPGEVRGNRQITTQTARKTDVKTRQCAAHARRVQMRRFQCNARHTHVRDHVRRDHVRRGHVRGECAELTSLPVPPPMEHT
eukprot:1005845-Rhodomonas_salina.1